MPMGLLYKGIKITQCLIAPRQELGCIIKIDIVDTRAQISDEQLV